MKWGTSLGAVLCAAITSSGASACVGSLTPGGNDANPPGDDSAAEAAARSAFYTRAWPALQACAACHVTQAGSEFMKATKEATYDHIVAFSPSVVNLEAPASSRVVVKPDHAGLGLTPAEQADVVEWIELQKVAAADSGDAPEFIATDLVALTLGGENTIALDSLGLAGARVEFLAEMYGEILYVSDLVINSGTSGARIVHPLFVSWDNTAPIPDPADRFFDYDVNYPANEVNPIGGGTAAFVGFAPTNRLSIYFQVLDTYQSGGGAGGGNGGCRVVTSFTNNARQALSQSCGSCHANANNGGATGAMDIVGVNDTTPATQKTVCDQVLLRVNKDAPNMSGIFIAADPSSGTGHPFKFQSQNAFTTFRNQVSLWITEESTAP